MSAVKRKKITSEEFLAMTPGSDSERCELIYGEIFALAAPSTAHQRICGGFYSEIRRFIKSNGGKCEPFISPYDVRLDDMNVVQPDVMVVCDPSKIDDKRCNGAPDLIIEVTSSNHSRDYTRKLPLYFESGVREYWIVDIKNEKILVFFFADGESPTFYAFEQDVPVNIFDGRLKLKVSEMM